MQGLYLLFLFFVWTVLTIVLNVVITKRLPKSKWRPFIGISLFVVLWSLLLIDEVIGKWQFERLCKKQAEAIYIALNANGRTVYLADGPPEEAVQWTLVPVWLKQWQYLDAATDGVVVSYNFLHASSGWFMRTFFEGYPLLYRNSCEPSIVSIGNRRFEEHNIKLIERKDVNKFKENLTQGVNK